MTREQKIKELEEMFKQMDEAKTPEELLKHWQAFYKIVETELDNG